jgi:hypothetical protein
MNRRNALKIFATGAALALYTPALLLTGCWDAGSIASLVQTLGGASSSLAAILGNTALAATITNLTAQAVAAVGSWKPGTPTAEAIEAINLLEGAIGQITGISPTVALLITLALGTADAILALLPRPAVTGQVMVAMNKRQRVRLNNPPKKKAEFRTQWNGLIDGSADATLMAAKI